MDELVVGDPALLSTDVGPVIDAEAKAMLEAHSARMSAEARLIRRVNLGPGCERGHFFAPVAFEIDSLALLEREVFGPILHVIRYPADRLDKVIERKLRVGNAYVNRNMIGAVVGVQPFGGEGLSGTGPKAGGPRYLHRFATERTLSIDTTAAGGNASLMSLGEDLPV
jgi:RHH-type proline utilization regulon transcriptional repressor/proline dehydrogenase/delta 1-pyrroline-5-carboxylate dehydrogenase